jgi:pimeloyl-ACP methyl ester carboxylesterase
LPVRAVVSLAGVCDLRRAWQRRLSAGVTRQVMGGAPAKVPERYAAASPAELLPLGVAQVLIHGTADDSVPYDLSADYAAAARAAGDPATLITLRGADHFAIVDPAAPEWAAVRRAMLPLLGLAV